MVIMLIDSDEKTGRLGISRQCLREIDTFVKEAKMWYPRWGFSYNPFIRNAKCNGNITWVLPSVEGSTRHIREIKISTCLQGVDSLAQTAAVHSTWAQAHTRTLKVMFIVKKKKRKEGTEKTNSRALSRGEGTKVRWDESQKASCRSMLGRNSDCRENEGIAREETTLGQEVKNAWPRNCLVVTALYLWKTPH